MNTPRFTVGSVSGYGDAGRFATVWYVFDSAYCYRRVREFKQGRNTEKNARIVAALLNGATETVHLCPVCSTPFTPELRSDPWRLTAYCSPRCGGRAGSITAAGTIKAALARGEVVGRAKLTDAQVAEIREQHLPGAHPARKTGRSTSELAARFGVTVAYVAQLINRRWRNG